MRVIRAGCPSALQTTQDRHDLPNTMSRWLNITSSSAGFAVAGDLSLSGRYLDLASSPEMPHDDVAVVGRRPLAHHDVVRRRCRPDHELPTWSMNSRSSP
jgi:hypothetical protein